MRSIERILGGLLAVALLIGCNVASTDDPVRSKDQALTTQQARVLGFESVATDWSLQGSGQIAAGTPATQGQYSMAVNVGGYSTIASVAIAAPGSSAAFLDFDLRLNQTASWGEVRLVVVCPSRGLYWTDVGGFTLAGRSAGTFHQVHLTAPSAVRSAVDSNATDLSFRLTVNAPNGTQLRVDNLRVNVPTAPPPPPPPPYVASLSMPFPAPLDFRSMLLSASESVTLDDRVTVGQATTQPPPNVASMGPGKLDVGASVSVYGTIYSGASIDFLRSGSTVYGDVYARQAVTFQQGATIQGTVHENAIIQPTALSWTVTWPNTQPTVLTVPPDQPNQNVNPGLYSDVLVNSRSTVTLRSGLYFADSFVIEPDAHLRVDTTQGPVLLYVKTTLRLNVTVEYIGPSGQLLMGYLGTTPALLREALAATVVAPNSVIELRRPNVDGFFEGAFFGKNVHLFPDVKVRYLGFTGDPCTGSTTCSTTTDCSQAVIDDQNPCTIDACTQQQGITHTPAPTGTSCQDQNACNGAETCNGAGACQAGTPVSTSDGNACTTDSCDPANGNVTHVPVVIVDDGDPCTEQTCNPSQGPVVSLRPAGYVCGTVDLCHESSTCNVAGACVAGPPKAIDTSNPCLLGTCNLSNGTISYAPAPAGYGCPDATLCNGNEACNGAGVCLPGTAPIVADSNPCTTDACSPTVGVTHLPVAAGTSCANANLCDGQETCNSVGVCTAGSLPAVDDQNPCTADSCDPTSGVAHVPLPEGTNCGTGNLCLAPRACSATGVCEFGPAPVIDDQIPCTVDECDPATGAVSHELASAGSSCADGNACNGEELCSAAGQCLAGAAPGVDDGNPCTTDSCDAASGIQHVAVALGTSCDDDDLCNGQEACSGVGICGVVPGSTPDDGNDCTIDLCTETGVEHVPAPEDSACIDACGGVGACTASGTCERPALEAGPCAHEVCLDGQLELVPVAPGTTCSDSSVCNGLEWCDGLGSCEAGTPLQVDDQNACTVDVCDPALGVSHQVQAGQACDDGNPCTAGDTCSASGQCVAGPVAALDDGNPCTLDACNPLSGTVQNTPRPAGSSCTDANICNGQEVCSGAGVCLAGTPLPVDDNDPCTVDSCSPGTGVSHVYVPGSACPEAPTSWVTTYASRPSPRDSAAVGWDPLGELALVFGGNNAGAILNDTWLYDGISTKWRRIQTPSPAARAGASMIFEPDNQRFVLFGGIADDRQTYLSDTWVFDLGTETWTVLEADGALGARAYAAVSHNPVTGITLLFGGQGDVDFADTWMLGGSGWTPVGGAGPSARWGSSFVHDAAEGTHLLFGGGSSLGSGLVFADAWSFDDGSLTWAPVATEGPTAPEARLGHSSYYSAEHGGVVVSGGVGTHPGGELEAWVYDGDQWLAVPEARTSKVGAGSLGDAVFGGLRFGASGLVTPQYSDVQRGPEDEYIQGAAPGAVQGLFTASTYLLQRSAFDSSRGVWVVFGSELSAEYPPLWEFTAETNSWVAKNPWYGSEIKYVPRENSDYGVYFMYANSNVFQYAGGIWQGRVDYPGKRGSQAIFELAQWDGDRFVPKCVFPRTAFASLPYFNEIQPFGLLAHDSTKTQIVNPATCSVQLLTGLPMPVTFDSYNRPLTAGSRLVVFTPPTSQQTDYRLSVYGSENYGTTFPMPASIEPVYDAKNDRLIGLTGNNLDGTYEYHMGTRTWRRFEESGEQKPGAQLFYHTALERVFAVTTIGQVWSLNDDDLWERRDVGATPPALSGFSGGFSKYQGWGYAFGGVTGDGQRKYSNQLWLYDGEWRLVEGWAGQQYQDQLPRGTQTDYRAVQPVSGHALGVGAYEGTSIISADRGTPWLALVGGENEGGYSPSYYYDIKKQEWKVGQGLSTIDGAITLAPAQYDTQIPPGYFYFGGFTYADAGRTQRTASNESRFIGYGSLNLPWTLAANPRPEGRWGHAMATNISGKKILMFGGRNGEHALGDTWMIDLTVTPAAWEQIEPAHAPSPRFGHSMVFDERLGKIVLVGGVGSVPGDIKDDTWAFDFEAMDWRKVRAQNLVGRSDHTAMFDTVRQKLVVFGGARHHANGQFVETLRDTQTLEATLSSFHHAQENGSACAAEQECQSGNCVDGVCCNTACEGSCGACDVPGHEGTCVPIEGIPQGARPQCESGEDDGCGLRCNGDSYECTQTPDGQSCGLALGCSGTFLTTQPGVCQAGACQDATVDCSPYVCYDQFGSPRCLLSCTSTQNCEEGYICSQYQECLGGVTDLLAEPASVARGETLTMVAEGAATEFNFYYHYLLPSGEQATVYPCGQVSTSNRCSFVVPDAPYVFLNVQGRPAGRTAWTNMTVNVVFTEAP